MKYFLYLISIVIFLAAAVSNTTTVMQQIVVNIQFLISAALFVGAAIVSAINSTPSSYLEAVKAQTEDEPLELKPDRVYTEENEHELLNGKQTALNHRGHHVL